MAPAIVLHPFPPELAAGSGGGGGGATCSRGFEPALVVELFCSDEDEGLLNGPVSLAVFSGQGSGGGGGCGGGGALDKWNMVVVGVGGG